MERWSIGSAIPGEEKSLQGCACVGEKIYCFGGVHYGTAPELPLAELWIYDTAADTWSRGPAMPTARYALGCAAVGEKIYCVGGYVRGANGQNEVTGRIEVFDTAAGGWSTLGFGALPIMNHACVACGNKLYCVGGNPSSFADHRYMVIVDLDMGASYRGAERPDYAMSVAAALVGDEVFVTGGYLSGGMSAGVYAYSVAGGTWRKAAPCQYPRYWHGMAAVEDQLYLFGADTSMRAWERYDTGLEKVVDQGFMEEGKSQFCCAAVGRRIYLLSGIETAATGTRTLIYDARVYQVVGAAPASGFVNEHEDNRFTWSVVSSPPARQERATFEWRRAGAQGSYFFFVTGEETAVTVPAGTFPDDWVQWRVKSYGEGGLESGYTEWMTLTTMDEPPGPPTNLYPSGGVRNGAAEIVLSWLHNAPLGTAQSAYEAQVSYDGGGMWLELSGRVQTGLVRHIVPADTFAPGESGNVAWRVRTFDSDGMPGEWSDPAFFVVYPAPDPPGWRSVEAGRSRPEAGWVAGAQQVFQLQVMSGGEVVYDSGQVYDSRPVHRVADYLPDGQYLFRVRIQNRFGLWSDWAEYAAQVAVARRLDISLAGAPVADGGRLIFDAEVLL